MKRTAILAICAAILCGCAPNNENTSLTSTDNTTLSDILSRTSIRQYTDEDVADSQLEALLRAGMAAPSCCNIQPWHFVVVKDSAMRQQMADAFGPAKPAAKAPVVIVVCGDMQTMRESPVSDNPDYWVCDACAATENILVAAKSLHLGGVWMGVWPMQNRIATLQQLLGLPNYIIPLNMIAIGHPAENPEPKDKWKPERIHHDKW